MARAPAVFPERALVLLGAFIHQVDTGALAMLAIPADRQKQLVNHVTQLPQLITLNRLVGLG